jgi:hypothetical protein
MEKLPVARSQKTESYVDCAGPDSKSQPAFCIQLSKTSKCSSPDPAGNEIGIYLAFARSINSSDSNFLVKRER